MRRNRKLVAHIVCRATFRYHVRQYDRLCSDVIPAIVMAEMAGQPPAAAHLRRWLHTVSSAAYTALRAA